jgi:hypothetical protein
MLIDTESDPIRDIGTRNGFFMFTINLRSQFFNKLVTMTMTDVGIKCCNNGYLTGAIIALHFIFNTIAN